MKPLTRRYLDKQGCDNPACTNHEEHLELFFHSQCHTGMPHKARYDKRTGILTLSCAVCDLTTGRFKVAP